MNRPRCILLLLSAVGALLIILFVSLPTMVERLAASRLEQLGLGEARVEIADLGLKATRIQQLKFVYRGGERRFELAASDIHLSYRLVELLSGRLEHIQMPTVEVRVSVQPGASVETPLPTIPPPDEWLPSLPFRQLTLAKMRVVNEPIGDVDIQADIKVSDERLQAKLDLEASDREPLHADLSLMPRGDTQLVVSNAMTQQPTLSLTSGALSVSRQRLQAEVEVESNLQALQSALTSWQLVDALPALTGRFRGQGELSLPLAQDAQPPLAGLWLDAGARLDVEMPGVYGPAEGINVALPFTVKLKEEMLQWSIEDSARVAFYPRLEEQFDKASPMHALLQRQGRQPVIITAPAGVSGQSRLDAEFFARPRMQTSDALRLDYGEAGATMELQVLAQALDVTLHPSLHAQSMLTFDSTLRDAGLLPAKSARSKGSAKLVVSEDTLMLALQPATALTVDKLALTDVVVPSLKAKLATTADCDYQLDNAQWQCTPFRLDMLLPSATFDDTTLHSGSGRLRVNTLAGTASGWSVKAQGDITNVSLQAMDNSVQLDNVQAAVQADQQAVKAQLTLSAVDGAINAHIDALHEQASSSGRAKFKIDPVSFTTGKPLFARLLGNWPVGLQLDKGRLLTEGSLNWQPEKGSKSVLSLDQATRISLQGIGGAYREITFTGLDSELALQGVASPRLETPAAIRLATLNPGFPITDIALQAAMSVPPGGKPLVSITGLQAQALGGQIAGDRIELDLAQERNPFTVRVSGIDIAELLKLEQEQGLYGSGVIDGELPLVLSRDGLSMQQGKLAARDPGGIIRYDADERVRALAQGNPNLQLLLDALRDFHYHLLQADVDYAPDGNLDLHLKLEGKNPELEGGRPVHLNVNVEENVLMLLRSLRLADEISEKVGEQIQQREQHR